MSVAYAYDTVPAYPLGQPHDGSERYGMLPEQAALYRWLVRNRDNVMAFDMNFRSIAICMKSDLLTLHRAAQGLIERGWLRQIGRKFAFVQPIMHFKAPANG